MSLALIVEDDMTQAEHLAGLVREHGFRPALARSGQSALTLARLLQPDLALLGLALRDIDGFELCRRLRTEERTIATPIILITDLESSFERRRGFRVGANAYLAKPIQAEKLNAAIQKALSWRAGLDRARIQGEIQVELHSDSQFLCDVNEFLTALCRRTPLTNEQLMHLRQAFMEMGLNAIEWGNHQRTEKLVTILYRIFDDRIEITVRDEGSGFNPEELPHAASPDDPIAHLEVRERLGLREGGFGLMIARGMLDELRYNDQGNEVTLIKRFPPTQRGEAANQAIVTSAKMDNSSNASVETPGPTLRGFPIR